MKDDKKILMDIIFILSLVPLFMGIISLIKSYFIGECPLIGCLDGAPKNYGFSAVEIRLVILYILCIVPPYCILPLTCLIYQIYYIYFIIKNKVNTLSNKTIVK